MRLGVLLMPTDPWEVSVARGQELERLGYHHLWVYDHFSWRRYRDRPWFSAYPWLTGMAGATSTIRMGTMVANPNIRHPLTLAKDAMTIDHISHGRLTLGIGAGGLGFDAEVFGRDALSPGERLDRLAEFVTVVDGLLRGELTTHRGDRYVIEEARMHPGCVQQPRVPLMIAGGGRRALGLAARFGDAWVTAGDSVGGDWSEAGSDAAVRLQCADLDEQCDRIGRDPSSIDRVFLVGNTEARPLASIDAFDDFVGRHGALGFTDIVFHDPRPDDPVWNEPPEIVTEIATRHLP